MKIMSFKKKIDKILETNELGISSINALEKEIGASTGSVNKYYNKDKSPGRATVKKIKTKFEIDDSTWKSGEIQLRKSSTDFINDVETVGFMRDMWHQVKSDSDLKQKEIDRLWKLIERMELPGDAVKRVTPQN
jgi:hypothetical protein